MEDLRRIGLGDEAVAIKYFIINLASSLPFFGNLFFAPSPSRGVHYLPRQLAPPPVGFDDRKKLDRRVNDLDNLLNSFEKVTSDFRSLPSNEKEKLIERNEKTLEQLNKQHTKLSKKCFYIRNRIEYLLNELHSSSAKNTSSRTKSVMDRLMVWKRFIENNEYILNQRLTREERETLYTFLATKLKETEPDIRESEGVLFDF